MTCPTCSLSLNIHRSDTDTVDPLYEGRHVVKLQMKEKINQYVYILHLKVIDVPFQEIAWFEILVHIRTELRRRRIKNYILLCMSSVS